MRKGKRFQPFCEVDEDRDGLSTETPLAPRGHGLNAAAHLQMPRPERFAFELANQIPLNRGRKIGAPLAAERPHVVAEDDGRGPTARKPS